MARFPNYPKKQVTTSTNLLARDPAGNGQVSRVNVQDLMNLTAKQIEESGGTVKSIDTLDQAIATDYASGVYVLVGGGSVVLDGQQAIYRVSDTGSSGIPMDNGNELVILFNAATGTAASKDTTTSPTDTTPNVVKLNEHVNVLGRGSVADLIGLTGAYTGQQCEVVGYHPNSTVGGGTFVYGTGTHNGGTFIDPTRVFPTPAQWANGSTDPAVIAWLDTSGGVVDGWIRKAGSLNQYAFGAFGSGYPQSDSAQLNAYANYCRSSKSIVRLVASNGASKHYGTTTVDLSDVQVVGDGNAHFKMGVGVPSDGIGFDSITGIPSRPSFATLYASASRQPDHGVVIYSDVANPVAKISQVRYPFFASYKGFGVQGYAGTAGQYVLADDLEVAYQGARYDLEDVGVFSGGAGGILLPNGLEVSGWKKVVVQYNNGYGVEVAGGGGDDNQEYFTAEQCDFRDNRLDGFYMSLFRKGVKLSFCSGNSNGWYGYGPTYSITKPALDKDIVAMARIGGNQFGAANFKVVDCYGEDCAKLVQIEADNPMQNINISNNRTFPTLGLAVPASDTRNDVVSIHTTGSGQFRDLNIHSNSIQDELRGDILSGTAAANLIVSSTIGNNQSSTYSKTEIENTFETQVNIESAHIFSGFENIGDGTAGTFTSDFIKNNLRVGGQGNNSHSRGTAFLITSNWASTNADNGGAYIMYAFVLPNGNLKGEAQLIGAGSGFTAAPTLALDGTLSVPIANFYRSQITRIDMNGYKP